MAPTRDFLYWILSLSHDESSCPALISADSKQTIARRAAERLLASWVSAFVYVTWGRCWGLSPGARGEAEMGWDSTPERESTPRGRPVPADRRAPNQYAHKRPGQGRGVCEGLNFAVGAALALDDSGVYFVICHDALALSRQRPLATRQPLLSSLCAMP